MPGQKEKPLGFDQLGFQVEAVGSIQEPRLLGIVDGKSVNAGPNIPGKIKGQALIVQTSEGRITAIPAPQVNLEGMRITVMDFTLFNPPLQQEVLNALRRSRQQKRERIGQLVKSDA